MNISKKISNRKENAMNYIIIKLNRQVESLENVISKLNERIRISDEKQAAIEEKARERGREMTEKEWERYDKLSELRVKCENEIFEIEGAIRRLEDYCS